MVKIVGILGSLRSDSYSALALQQAINRVRALGAEAEILDLRDMSLPFCDGGSEYPDYPDIEVLRDKVKAADGLILATPEYHGSVSGVLTNSSILKKESKRWLTGLVTTELAILSPLKW